MQLTITGRKMEVTDSLRSFAEKKLKKVEKLFHRDMEARVVLSVEKQRHSAEATLSADGFILHAKEITEDMYSSIDKLVDKVEKLAKKHKKRVIDKHSKKDSKHPLEELAPLPLEKEIVPVGGKKALRITRETVNEKKPLTEEQAMKKLHASGNEFLVFLNSESREINVIYKKFDGNFGLIEP